MSIIDRNIISLRKPDCLRPGDTVALLAPASAVKEEYCDGAERWLLNHGFKVKRYPSARGCVSGSFSAPQAERLAEIKDALEDEEVKAILCGRGGYGCVHLLEELTPVFRRNPKWIAGFSDVSAFHAMAAGSGCCSLHSSMAKHLSLYPDDEVSAAIYEILTTGKQPEITYSTYPGSVTGVAEGVLAGGNLAVLNSLAATPWDIFAQAAERPVILFLEDISEAIYAVERMLYRLKLSGCLGNVKGLVFGQFTEYRPDRNYGSMEEMLAQRLAEWGVSVPVALHFPAGHIDGNRPLLLGSVVKLEVGAGQTRLAVP